MRRVLASLACAGAAGLCAPLSGAWAAEAPVAPGHELRAPNYGDVLFHFYQDATFSAISSLMVSQHFDRLRPHDDEAEVLRGGLLLAWGMHAQAGEVFERLIARGTAPAVRDRAWFFLARVRHARGLQAEALDALQRIEGTLSPGLQAERGLLLAQVQLALDHPTEAAQALNALAGAPDASGPELPDDAVRYARYNLGVALIRSGEAEPGQRWLDQLGQTRAATEEQRSLRDQANLALGFAALQREQPAEARAWLERVRLQGPFSNKALLGFGWAALAQKDPSAALVPWQELLGRDPADPAVQEARIALPYALAELGAQAQSLSQYQQALDEFQREQGQLAQAMDTLRGPAWLEQLLSLNPAAQFDANGRLDTLPDLPYATELAPTLAGHAFQEGFKALRDLQFLQQRLRQWQDTLAGFGDMLALRRDAFAQRLPLVREQARQLDLAGLQARGQALSAELDQARAQQDGVAFAGERERGLLQRLARARTTLAALGAAGGATATEDADLAAAGERLRLVSGALAWQLAQAAPDGLWDTSKSLKTLEVQTAQARDGLAALEQAERDQAQRFVAFGQRIAALSQRIQTVLPQLEQLSREQAVALQELAVAGLQAQQQRLNAYSTQARYAMAQLQDRARPGQEDAHATPR